MMHEKLTAEMLETLKNAEYKLDVLDAICDGCPFVEGCSMNTCGLCKTCPAWRVYMEETAKEKEG